MFQSDAVTPVTGGALAAAFRRVREEVAEKREQLVKPRAEQPTVAEFYKGRGVFITGGSGFLGRLLVEMLLRTCPDIGNVYLLLRSKKGESPSGRLQGLLNVPLFDRLRAEQPHALDKIVVLPGDITELGLGLSQEHRALLQREVSVVYHVAASVRFDDPFQKAVFTNLRSTREVVELARGMPLLKSLVHVSTAYCNADQMLLHERVYRQRLDWRDVVNWAENLNGADVQAVNYLGHKLMGSQANSYVFTKALAEQLLEEVADELPVVITRPSIVVPTFKDPIPGWIDNLYGLSGFWAGGFKGLMRIVPCKDLVFNSVPADVATKNTVLASWHKGIGRSFPRPAAQADAAPAPADAAPVADVVNVVIMKDSGVSFTDMSWVVSEAGLGRIVPFPGAIRPPKFENTPCHTWYLLQAWYHHYLFGFILDMLSRAAGIKPRVLGIYRTVVVALDATQSFWKQFDFDNDNLRELQTMMHPDDERDYCIMDLMSSRDSKEALRAVSIPCVRGILKYTLKEEDNPEKNWKMIERLKWVMAVYHTAMGLAFCGLVYSLTPRVF
ncbi:putative fatty acyl-CoA reductase CG5065 [Frankliniella occidentalis]|uniref:Fatty acyl-CoA reductase n=1 Tax=Frankliniella occidentalis TaxID=133901 RepID=A0A9C6WM61_FRAOC|nr:putative fatty acyl-CoA reductase CG5065 [Frankliniella occidentalis]